MSSEWSGICDSFQLNQNRQCHCNQSNKVDDKYKDVECSIIYQQSYEKALAIILFLYGLIVIGLCTYWLITFWNHRMMKAYHHPLKLRRPIYIIISYTIILPFIFLQCVSTMCLFWNPTEPKRYQKWDGVNYWTQVNGLPIYFNMTADMILHFFYWFGFWAFFHFKVFKFCELRYRYEYNKEMNNIEWKDHYGLRTVEPTSFYFRHKSNLENPRLIIGLYSIILILIISIQLIIRLIPIMTESPKAATIESVIILIIVAIQFTFVAWLTHQTIESDDIFFLKLESKRIFIASLICLICWVIGFIVFCTVSNIPFILIRSGTILLFTTWIFVFCYFETMSVLKCIDIEWNEKKSLMLNPMLHLKLVDILKFQQGFEAMMRFLVKEFSCENLLCYVEMTQYISMWGQPPPIWAKLKETDALGATEEFTYFEDPEFETEEPELSHYIYLTSKYLYNSSLLPINVSDEAKVEAYWYQPGHHELYQGMNALRGELWSLLRDSYIRFRATVEYKKLAEMLNDAEFKRILNNHNTDRCNPPHGSLPNIFSLALGFIRINTKNANQIEFNITIPEVVETLILNYLGTYLFEGRYCKYLIKNHNTVIITNETIDGVNDMETDSAFIKLISEKPLRTGCIYCISIVAKKGFEWMNHVCFGVISELNGFFDREQRMIGNNGSIDYTPFHNNYYGSSYFYIGENVMELDKRRLIKSRIVANLKFIDGLQTFSLIIDLNEYKLRVGTLDEIECEAIDMVKFRDYYFGMAFTSLRLQTELHVEIKIKTV